MTWAGKGKVAVAGIGFSALTRRSEQHLGKLAFDAANAALADAGLEASQVDGLATYIMGGTGRDGVDSVSADYFLKHYTLSPDFRWYAELQQGMIASAVIEGANAIISGMANYVLVWRAMHNPPDRPYTQVTARHGAGRLAVLAAVRPERRLPVARHGLPALPARVRGEARVDGGAGGELAAQRQHERARLLPRHADDARRTTSTRASSPSRSASSTATSRSRAAPPSC